MDGEKVHDLAVSNSGTRGLIGPLSALADLLARSR